MMKLSATGLALGFLMAAFHAPQPVASLSQGDIATILDAHNRLRARHGAPPLTWSDSLANAAQSWANQCRMEHSHGKFGENLAWGSSSWRAAVEESWYKGEIGAFNFAKAQFSLNTGHFTQIVWRDTKRIGCGFNPCPSLPIHPMYVCEYDPPGNVIGAFAQNVLRPLSSIGIGGARLSGGTGGKVQNAPAPPQAKPAATKPSNPKGEIQRNPANRPQQGTAPVQTVVKTAKPVVVVVKARPQGYAKKAKKAKKGKGKRPKAKGRKMKNKGAHASKPYRSRHYGYRRVRAHPRTGL
ncbi:uncharacterized protein VTP21DRAFT_2948 [Calcarisporiella thermophila]|uniref:uncharacterized protein n=1 Tax=Calcarisporiella thermophila TaxID=911321 RepID=UPI003741EE6E